jgi:murein DD-endopeptidase
VPVFVMTRPLPVLFCCAYIAWGLMLQGCASAPEKPARPTAASIAAQSAPPVSIGNEIAFRAISLLGAPYKWGGAGPTDFDCSGLVRYIHGQLGIATPRTAAEQFSAAKPVALSGLAPGDLLFFRIKGSRISHVAIYAGEGRFVHAPQKGRPVELRTLDDEFYRPKLAGAGRMF